MTGPRSTIVTVAFLLGLLGFLTSRPVVLQWLSTQTPGVAFLLWYVVLFAFVQAGALLLFHKLDFRTLRLGAGIIIATFAAGIVLYWPSSEYAIMAVGANPLNVPTFLIASEDQLTFTFWRFLFPWAPNDLLGLLTYVLTPVVLILIAGLFLVPRQLTVAFRGLLRTA